MKFSHEAVISAPVDNVDLEEWLFTLSHSEYQAAARGHRAAGTFTENGVRSTVNVESMGGTLMVQHYHAVSAEPTRVEMLSERSRAYVMHLIPVHFLVRWTMTATPRTTDTTTFDCTVEIDMPTLVRFAAKLTGAPYFVRKHVHEEAPNFAADIERKVRARVLAK